MRRWTYPESRSSVLDGTGTNVGTTLVKMPGPSGKCCEPYLAVNTRRRRGQSANGCTLDEVQTVPETAWAWKHGKMPVPTNDITAERVDTRHDYHYLGPSKRVGALKRDFDGKIPDANMAAIARTPSCLRHALLGPRDRVPVLPVPKLVLAPERILKGKVSGDNLPRKRDHEDSCK
jgi:hypothetical protein